VPIKAPLTNHGVGTVGQPTISVGFSLNLAKSKVVSGDILSRVGSNREEIEIRENLQ
jgi:hypothetical protein